MCYYKRRSQVLMKWPHHYFKFEFRIFARPYTAHSQNNSYWGEPERAPHQREICYGEPCTTNNGQKRCFLKMPQDCVWLTTNNGKQHCSFKKHYNNGFDSPNMLHAINHVTKDLQRRLLILQIWFLRPTIPQRIYSKDY